MSTGPDEEPTTEEPQGYEWPDEGAADQEYRPGFYILAIMYAAPFLILLLFPALAWLALLPLILAVRWNVHEPHRRRLVWIYLITGLISLAPWIALLIS